MAKKKKLFVREDKQIISEPILEEVVEEIKGELHSEEIEVDCEKEPIEIKKVNKDVELDLELNDLMEIKFSKLGFMPLPNEEFTINGHQAKCINISGVKVFVRILDL